MEIVDWFDKRYSEIQDRNPVFTKLKIYSVARVVLRILANVIIPYYFRLTKYDLSNQLAENQSEPQLIVSLTTFPARINKIWITIESILRQSHKPDRIILWLSKEYFRSIDHIPKSLRNLKKRGLEIRFVDDDIRAHKKYYYSMSEFPNAYILTVDDDIIYPSFVISKLVQYRDRFPQSMICHRALKIKSENRVIEPYTSWRLCFEETEPSHDLFITTGGGTLIPPHCLYSDVLNIDLFKKISLNSDDMWLNCMARLNNISTVKTDYYSHCLPILYLKSPKLSTINVDNGENDRQIESIRTHYIQSLGIDPYWRLFQ